MEQVTKTLSKRTTPINSDHRTPVSLLSDTAPVLEPNSQLCHNYTSTAFSQAPYEIPLYTTLSSSGAPLSYCSAPPAPPLRSISAVHHHHHHHRHHHHPHSSHLPSPGPTSLPPAPARPLSPPRPRNSSVCPRSYAPDRPRSSHAPSPFRRRSCTGTDIACSRS